MGKEYVGTIILTINGVDIECKSLSPDRDWKRKTVPTMNRLQRAQGYTQGVAEFKLSVTAPVQPSGLEIPWEDIVDATLSISNRKGELLEMYHDVFTMKIGTKYEMEGESVHDVEMGALDYTNMKATIAV